MEKQDSFLTRVKSGLPAFFMGVGSLLNLSGNRIHFSRRYPRHKTDSEAIRSDWEKVGQDLWFTILQERSKHKAT